MSGQEGQEAYQAAREDLEDLYENAPCGYLSLGVDGRVVKANATFANWTGFSAAGMIGKPFRSLMTVGSGIFYETHHLPLLALQGRFDGVSVDLKTARGEKLAVVASALERRTADGHLRVTRLTLIKAAERRRYEQELVEARAAAAAASARSGALEATTQNLLSIERETSRLREQFIAVLGHDLRNPLASISGGIRLLSIEPQSEKARQFVAMMQGSVLRMAALIDNVLDFARGRLGGGIALNLQSNVSLEPIFQQVVSELRIGAPDREMCVEFKLAEPVTCDPTRIEQLASNLLSNALTHGAADAPVRLEAAVEAGALTIEVANGGKPIAPEAMERLFQPFFRGEVRPSLQGLGLGLHIASEIAKAHGGALTVDSSEVETRFTFRMPRQAPAPDPEN